MSSKKLEQLLFEIEIGLTKLESSLLEARGKRFCDTMEKADNNLRLSMALAQKKMNNLESILFKKAR